MKFTSRKKLPLHYYDDVHPKPGPPLGQYSEKFTVASNNNEYILSIEGGKLAKKDVASHQSMWDRALSIIKGLAEKKVTLFFG